MQMIDVHLPTTDGRELLLTRYTEPECCATDGMRNARRSG